MAAFIASDLLRPGLLEGRSLVLAGAGPFGAAAAAGCAALGARVNALDEDAVADLRTADALVNDGAALYAAAPADGGLAGLRAALDGAWSATHAIATAAFIPEQRGGRVINIAPPAGAGPLARAARDGLENMARTLSIEWARYGILVTTIAPGERTTPDEVGALCAFLASPAGDYYSGCRFSLGTAD